MASKDELKNEINETNEIVGTALEDVAENTDEKTTQEEFIAEFAPEPIKIPKYNK